MASCLPAIGKADGVAVAKVVDAKWRQGVDSLVARCRCDDSVETIRGNQRPSRC
jgi:hypothetical protein